MVLPRESHELTKSNADCSCLSFSSDFTPPGIINKSYSSKYLLNSSSSFKSNTDLVHSLYVPSIDSFRYRIELSEVDILNRNLLDHIIVQRINETTGELITLLWLRFFLA